MLPVKASLLVPGREFIISRRKKLVPKMQLGDSDNRLLVAKSGTCTIPGCFSGCRNHSATMFDKILALTHSDVFEVQTLFEPSTSLKNTLRENAGHNT